MARTRTQAGVIKVRKYDYKTIRAVGEKPSTGTKGGKGRNRKQSSETFQEGSVVAWNDVNHERTPQPEQGRADITEGNHWWPSVILGAREEAGLSASERAQKLVTKWEKILEEHKEKLPEAVPHVEAQLALARNERDALISAEPTDNESQALLKQKRDEAVTSRIDTLLKGLESSRNVEEKKNIQGAIDAYRSGQIGYSKQYTLIWAGKVVDVADTYAEFAVGRKERLDRYEKEHGAHWLWFESPLWVHPESQAKAMRSTAVERVASSTEFGLYYINLGFWKREGLVTRMPQTSYTANMKPNPAAQGIAVGPDGTVNCGSSGPKLTIRSLLDSGATYPTLYASDFRSLGVYPTFYPAQSLADILTANGKITERVFEMHVEINDENGQSLVDILDPVNPLYQPYLGGLTPVLMIGLDDSPPITMDGYEDGIRLSGIMPFLAAYVSSTPSKNIILLGENRNDVLGAHKIPPVRRWMVGLPQDPCDRSQWINFGDPTITFSHRKGLIIDQDTGPGASKLTVNAGRGALERSETFNPRGDFLSGIGFARASGTIDPSLLNP